MSQAKISKYKFQIRQECCFQWYLLLFFRVESIQHQIRLHQSLTQQHLVVEDHRNYPAAEQKRQISPREQIKNCQTHSCLIKYLLYQLKSGICWNWTNLFIGNFTSLRVSTDLLYFRCLSNDSSELNPAFWRVWGKPSLSIAPKSDFGAICSGCVYSLVLKTNSKL